MSIRSSDSTQSEKQVSPLRDDKAVASVEMTHFRRVLQARVCATVLTSCALFPVPSLPAQSPAQSLQQGFTNPPADARPVVRWWWFGPAVTASEITHEIDQMHEGGFGGFELASVYPLALDDPAKGIRNLRYASPEMVAMLRVAQEHGRALGMRVDLTLGSGWPFGGPHIALEQAAGRLKVVALPLPLTAPLQLAEGDTTVSAFVAAGTPEHWSAAGAKQVAVGTDGKLNGAALAIDNTGPHVAVFFIASHTRQMVKRAAVGGEGYVLDHMARQAIDTHLHAVAEPMLRAFAGAPPTAVFSDSLEVYGSDWTANLPEEFRKRRGYDLLPHLPELAAGGTPEADAVRHDWGVTLSDLVRENYLQPLADFATANHTRFRSQTYGEPAATLSDERIPQLPEGEGPQWNAFSFTRWASSANHVFGNNITSAETWTWLHSPAFRATPLDMKAEADRMFLEGVNQIVGHGWPYSAPYAQEPGYSLYAAAVFNAHNPWWPVMPNITRYLQRVSWMLRQGAPANDVAILLPEADAQAAFRPGHVSVTDYMKEHITPALMQAVLQIGHNVDYIDGPALDAKGTQAKLLVVPPTTRMSLATAAALQRYVDGGGKLVFVGTVPSLPPGLLDAKDAPALAQAITRLQGHSTRVADEAALRQAMPKLLPADFDLQGSDGSIGFLHRHLANADIYFVANTSAVPQSFTLHTAATRAHAAWWNAETGEHLVAAQNESVTLPPYGSRLLVLQDAPDTAAKPAPRKSEAAAPPTQLTHWKAEFPGGAGSPALPTQTDTGTVWTASDATKFYSGEVRYSTTFSAQAMPAGERLLLRFAPGTPLPDTQPASKPGMRAWYDAPIREAALVYVNGKEAGALWHPPYELDLSALTKPGTNTLEVRVYNTAINELAGQPPRDYTALKAKYGDRFQMQDMQNLKPVSSGIFGAIELVRMREQHAAR